MANREEKTRALINYVLEYAVDKGYSLNELDLFVLKFRNLIYDFESQAKNIPLNCQLNKSLDQVLQVLDDIAPEHQ